MALLQHTWGPSGTLNSPNDFDRWQGNGAQTDPPFAADVLERCTIQTLRGVPCALIERFVGDAAFATHPARSQFVDLDEPDLADWVGDGEAGADADNAYRWYRWAVLVPRGVDLSYLGQPSAYFNVASLHHRRDQSPADTGGGQGALGMRIEVDDYGRYRWALARFAAPEGTHSSTGQTEVASWPFRFDIWEDIVVRVRWSYSSLGEMTVWRNRRPILVETGVGNCNNDAPSRGGGAPYQMIGVTGENDAYMAAYHKGIIIGDATSSFAEMHPEDSEAVPLERVMNSGSTVLR